jgi:amylosucrase
MIAQAGFEPYQHRRYLKDYYSGKHSFSPACGALFSVNEKTGDARISGSLASLCGLEKAVADNDEAAIKESVEKIVLMQAHTFFIGGLPMIFYGDEAAYLNDYSYLDDPSKSYDNRWMHRPVINWVKNGKREEEGTLEHAVFSSTQKLLAIRKKLSVMADKKNLTWLTPHNIHVSGYLRAWDEKRVYCLFNFNDTEAFVTWYVFKEHGMVPSRLYDHWSEETFTVGNDDEYLILRPYQFCVFEPA